MPKPLHRSTGLRAWSIALLLMAGLAAQAGDEQPIPLPFGSFFRLPVGAGGLEFSSTLQDANGRRVRLAGYMVAQEATTPGRFLFTPLPVQLSEHADGEADDLPPSTVTVLLDSTQSERMVALQRGRLVLTGWLDVGRATDVTGRVSWIRLRLDPDALANRPLDATTSTQAPAGTP